MRSYLIAIALIAVLGTGYYLMGGEEESPDSASSDTESPDEVIERPDQESYSANPAPRRMRGSTPPPPPRRAVSDEDLGGDELVERRERREERRRSRLAQFDSNGDGELDEEERARLLQARAARGNARNLEFFDSDGDGELNEDELAMKEQAQRDIIADRATRILGESDADNNGFISQSEVESSAPRMRRLLQNFEEVDSDGDEQVSPEELQEAMLARRERREKRARESAESE
jgi:Ca2+-binding EF-hand superfamily protein